MEFDPNAAAIPGAGIFGLPHGPEEALVHVLGVPFDATTSYRGGTSHGPDAVLAASEQVDLFDLHYGRPYEAGIWMSPKDGRILGWNAAARTLARPIIERGGATKSDQNEVARIEEIGALVNDAVRTFTAKTLEADKLPVILGGDHSTPFGAMLASAQAFPGLGILQFDAHADLRPAYEGFRWSHASVLHNVLAEASGVARVVQVGIRDLCEQEYEAIESDARVEAVYAHSLSAARMEGRVRALARETIARLPSAVHVTFDIDGLDPTLCPGTGTPVPGGLQWDEAMVWLDELSRSGRRIVSLDLNEVSSGPQGDKDGTTWDAIVGARLLYKLIGAALATRTGTT